MKHKLSILIYIKIIIPVSYLFEQRKPILIYIKIIISISYLFEQRNCILIAFLS